MQRLGAVFIAVCMVAISTSVGAIFHYSFGLSIPEASPIAFGILLTLLLIHYQISRVRDRMMLDEQMDDLTRLKLGLTKELQDVREMARQLDEDVAKRVRDEIEPLLSELDVIGTIVKQLAETCAELDERVQTGEGQVDDVREQLSSATQSVMALEQMLRANARALSNRTPRAEAAPRRDPAPRPVASEPQWADEPPLREPIAPERPVYETAAEYDHQPLGYDEYEEASAPEAADEWPPEFEEPGQARQPSISEEDEAAVRRALALGKIELFMQPIVTLPMRKPQYYEALTRLKTEDGGLITPDVFLPVCRDGNFMPMLDRMAMNEAFRLLRRLTDRGRAVDIFCNLSIQSLGDSDFFALMRDLFEQNQDLAEHVILEFRQADLRNFGILEDETLQLLRSMGFRFSVDQITNLGTDFDAFARKGIRFAKVAAPILTNKDAGRGLDIHPVDFSRVLSRKGVELIVTHVANESMLVSLVEFNVHLAQGDHFAPAKALKGAGNGGQGGVASSQSNEATSTRATPQQSSPRRIAPGPLQGGHPQGQAAQGQSGPQSTNGQPQRATPPAVDRPTGQTAPAAATNGAVANGAASTNRSLGENPRIAKALRALASGDGEDSDTRTQFRAVLAEAAGLLENSESRTNARIDAATAASSARSAAPEVSTRLSDRLPAADEFGLNTGPERGQFIDLSEPAAPQSEAARPRRTASSDGAGPEAARFERLIR
ncbi:EAL domain-containing protein [Cohaesibacter sp. ES.047]|nr:EAL domain-containing protein [Cohaesibacter sp. ES.047]